MRAGLLALAAVTASALSTGSASATATRPCSGPLPRIRAALPAPITIATGCGSFRVGRDGRVRLVSRSRLPVPQGVAWWPGSGVWERLEHGHLLIGRWRTALWRSHGRFPLAYAIGAIALGPRALAFSYGTRTPRLYLAPRHGRERPIASGEFPLGWTSGGLYTRRGRGGELLLRAQNGALRTTLARRVFTYAYGHASGSLSFLAHGTLVRARGARVDRLASLTRLGLSPRPSLQLEPLGRLLALRDQRRLVVLRDDGSLFATNAVPRGRTRVDGISSALATAPDGHAVAFTATLGNDALGSRGSETIYLLRSGAPYAAPVYAERLEFAVCERQAELAWHGRWLLYSASEGQLVAIDTARAQRSIDLSGLVRSLPGTSGDEGHVDFSATWAGDPLGA